MGKSIISIVVLAFLGLSGVYCNDNGDYNVGVGIADITGPAAGLGMMGYANPSQTATGIHTRLFSRAFIFRSGNGKPVVFVSADIAMMDQGLKYKVVEILQKRHDADLFTAQNVLVSGTHTHSGPGAYMQYLMYGITSLGFNRASFEAIRDGIVQSIEKAYKDLQPGKLLINQGKLYDANINRSPTSYDANPDWERELYPDGNTDKDMILVKILGRDDKELGVINWFPVHPVSMNNTNTLVSGDNKGYASMHFEYAMNPDRRPGQGDFVAAFASSNLGDVSPNTDGPLCRAGPQAGFPCRNETSTCCGVLGCYPTNCIAFGPGKDMEESTEIIGKKQLEKALALFNNVTGEGSGLEQLKGSVDFIHQYVDMTNYQVNVEGEDKTTCKPALGFSFAAGTIDGPGFFAFMQGCTIENFPFCQNGITEDSHPFRFRKGDSSEFLPFWDAVKQYAKDPSPELAGCHFPKPVLLPVGEFWFPYAWVPNIVETQILKIGNLYLIGIPGELTTMAGRRLRKTVEDKIKEKLNPNEPDPHVVIAGLSNVYTHYITTTEEYSKQRYEAASTLYGPYTLNAYQDKYQFLVENMMDGTPVAPEDPEGPENRPPDLIGDDYSQQLTLITPIVQDKAPLTKNFGEVLIEPVAEASPGEIVRTRFVGGHPRHSAMRGGTFLLVEKEVEGEDRWKIVATDADWSTKFQWSRPGSSENLITISWKVPLDAEPGFYRIRHFGYHKPSGLAIPRSYQGSTAIFKVAGPGSQSLTHPKWSPVAKKPKSILSAFDFWRALPGAAKKN